MMPHRCARVNKSADTSEAPGSGPRAGALRFRRLGLKTKLTAGAPRRAASLCASVSSVGD